MTGSLLYQTVKIFTDTQINLLTIKNGGNSNWSEHLYLLQSHSVKTYFKTPHNGLMKITRWDRLVRYAANINSDLLQEVLLVSPLLSWSHLSWTRLAVALSDMELPAVCSPSFA
jgi:hypothetical protein